MGVFSQETVSVGDLFVGAIVPGIMIVTGYLIYTIIVNRKEFLPIEEIEGKANILKTLLPPAALIFVVLGSIIAGIATPTEAAGVTFELLLSLGSMAALI